MEIKETHDISICTQFDGSEKEVLSNESMTLFFLILLLACKTNASKIPQQRIWWKFLKQHIEWNIIQSQTWHLMGNEMRDKLWKCQYRMWYQTFDLLVQQLTPYLLKFSQRRPLPTDLAVACVLHRLAYGIPPKLVALQYGIGTATVVQYTKQITRMLTEQLVTKFICMPSAPEQEKISDAFLGITGLPNIVGCIDGSYIRLARKPNEKDEHAAYWNRHDIYNVILQAVCDHRMLFLDVNYTSPGGQHDATVLRSSSIWTKMNQKKILRDPVIIVNGKSVQPYLLGDAAYPLMPFMLKRFDEGCTTVQHRFNKDVSRGRVKIENAFALLKNKWRILKILNVALPYATNDNCLHCFAQFLHTGW